MKDDPVLQDIHRLIRWFTWLTRMAIFVSFVHMAATLLLFSGEQWYEQLSAVGMILLVDVTEWLIVEYIFSALGRGRKAGQISPLLWLALISALVISALLNGGYLMTNAPANLSPNLSLGIAVFFALFVPLSITAGAVARAELHSDKASHLKDAQAASDERASLREQLAALRKQLEEAAQQLREAAQRDKAAAQTSTDLAHAEREIAQALRERDEARALAAQYREEAAQERAKAEQAAQTERTSSGSAAQTQAELARVQEQLARLQSERAQEVARLQEQLAQAETRSVQPEMIDALEVTRLLREPRDKPMPWREIGMLLKTSESTLRAIGARTRNQWSCTLGCPALLGTAGNGREKHHETINERRPH